MFLLNGEALSATARPRDVRVVEDELCRELRLLEVHLGAEERELRLLVDQDGHAVLRHLLVKLVLLRGVVEDVAEAVAASLADADLKRDLNKLVENYYAWEIN